METLCQPTAHQLAAAAAALQRGDLVAFATETVYGLGADCTNPSALAKIFRVKGRPTTHPLIVHLAGPEHLGRFTTRVDEVVQALCAHFWPGPLTLILPKHPQVPEQVTGGQDSVGLRCPAHPLALALLRAFQNGEGGIAAPSANRFGHLSPTCAQHVRDEFGANHPEIAYLLDGGQCHVGVESTILDLTSHTPRILRPGAITQAALEQVLNRPVATQAQPNSPRVSGALAQHYAPTTPCFLCPSEELASTCLDWLARGLRVGLLCLAPPPTLHAAALTQSLAKEEQAYAHDLYAALHYLDQAPLDRILIETPPVAWIAVTDRLQRACARDASPPY